MPLEFWGVLALVAISCTILISLAAKGDKWIKRRKQDKTDMTLYRLYSTAQRHPDFVIGNQALVGQNDVLLAVNKEADQLMIVGQTKNGIVAKRLRAAEIVAVEVITDVKTTTASLGGVLPFGDQFAGLVMGSLSQSELRGVWLKVLVRDVQQPWIVFFMPSLPLAEQWRGIIMLLLHQPVQASPIPKPASPQHQDMLLQAPAVGMPQLSDDLRPLDVADRKEAA